MLGFLDGREEYSEREWREYENTVKRRHEEKLQTFSLHEIARSCNKKKISCSINAGEEI